MRWVTVAVGALIGLAIAWTFLPIREWLTVVVEQIGSLGGLGVVVYFLLYFSLATATFPSTPLNIGAGLIFDLATGFFVAWIAGGLSSMVTFLFSRYIAKDWAQRRLVRFSQGERVLAALECQGFEMVLLARLNPFIPASLKNYGFGVTAILFRRYAAATLLGQAPIVLAYVYLGWAGSATLISGEEAEASHYVFIALGVVLSVTMLAFINWYGKKSLSRDAK